MGQRLCFHGEFKLLNANVVKASLN